MPTSYENNYGSTLYVNAARQTQWLAYIGAQPATGPPFTDGLTNVTGDITLDLSNGPFQQVTLAGGTVARTLSSIANPVNGGRLLLRIVSDATAAVDRTLALDASIHLPVEYIGPVTLPQGHVRTLFLYCTGAVWELQSIGGAYAV